MATSRVAARLIWIEWGSRECTAGAVLELCLFADAEVVEDLSHLPRADGLAGARVADEHKVSILTREGGGGICGGGVGWRRRDAGRVCGGGEGGVGDV